MRQWACQGVPFTQLRSLSTCHPWHVCEAPRQDQSDDCYRAWQQQAEAGPHHCCDRLILAPPTTASPGDLSS
jgi:hypothetical protein